jgi:polar amino acid transport system permease protein
VLLLLLYNGLPSAHILLSGFAVGVAALSIATGAYTSEIFRASFASVGRGQTEASLALGFSTLHAFRFVTLPQAVRIATPALVSWAILLFQGTSLCFAIAVPELTSRAYNQGSVSFDYFGALSLAGLLYAAVSIPASLLVSRLETRLGGARSGMSKLPNISILPARVRQGG